MPVNVGSASVTIMPSMSGFSSKMDKALGSAGSSGAGAFSKAFTKGTGGLSSSFDGASKACSGFSAKMAVLGGAVAGLVQSGVTRAFDAISSSMDSAISRVDTMNNFPRVMQNLGYSAEDAQASVQKMSDRLTGLPTRLDDLTSGVQRLVPAVGNVGQATDIMLAFNDAVLAGGSSMEVQTAATEQFSQAVSKGKFELEEWRSIQTAMPGQLDQLAKSMLGSSAGANDLYEALKDGKVSMGDFLGELVRLDTEGGASFASFQQQAQDATSGIATSLSNMQNAVTKGVAKVIDAIGAENISGVIQSFSSGITGAFDTVAGGLQTFLSRLNENGAMEQFGTVAATLGGIVTDLSTGFGSLLGALLGVPEGTDPAVTAADLLKAALDQVQPVLEAVRDATAWFRDNAAEAAPVVATLAGAFAGFRILQGLGGLVTSFSTALGGVGSAAAPAASALGSVGGAAAMSAPQILAVGGAIALVGVGVLAASAGLSMLAGAAIQIAAAGPGAAVALVGLVAAIAGLAAGATVVGPALTGASVGLLAFGAAVLMVGAGIGLATAGISLLAGQLPTIASSGAGAAAGLAAIGASSAVVGAGLVVAAAGVVAFGVALVAGTVGMAAFSVGIAAAALATTAAAAAFGLLGAAVNVLATGITTAADGIQTMGRYLPKVASAAGPAAAGLTEFAAAAAASSGNLNSAAPAIQAYGVAAVQAGTGIAVAASGTALLASSLAGVSAGALLASTSLAALAAAIPGVTAALGSLSASAGGLAAVTSAIAALGAAMLSASSSASSASGAIAAVAAALLLIASAAAAASSGASGLSGSLDGASASATGMGASVSALAGPLSAARLAFSSFADSASSESRRALSAIQGACAQMQAAVSGMRLRLPRIEVGALPHFYMSGSFNAETGSVPTVGVRWYAKGGYFDSASVIGIGEGRYDEVALPLSPKVLRGIGEGIAEQGGSGGDTYNVTVKGITYDDGTNVARAMREVVRAVRIQRRV